MRTILLVIFAIFNVVTSATAETIHYGYNRRGNYVPQEIDGKKIRYDYNHRGQYVPVEIDD